ncbi:MAG: hypothetical protein DRJ64_02955 [Thermoprotei archaeon]|nr:MAG: hypothetical protein DRJ64_02955 [Thermoprotei archaeon]
MEAPDTFSGAYHPSQTAHLAVSPFGLAARLGKAGVTLAPRLRPEPTPDSGSQLLYAILTERQRQAAVKLYGVFASHRGSLAYSPGQRFRRVPTRDSGEVVKPFKRAAN